MISSGHGVPAHSQDAYKANRFVLPILNIIQVVGRWAPFAPICRKCSTPSPLPSQLAKLALLQVRQHLNVGDLAQSVLDGFQAGHLVTSPHGDVCVQMGEGVLI